MEAQSLWHINKQETEIRSEKIDTNEVGVKSVFSMISTGTEKLVALGAVPIECSDIMCVPHMAGNFELPIKYGYSLIGNREDNGEMVHLMHPHQDFCHVENSCLYTIPNVIPPHRAALISNMETVINAIWDSEAGLEESVLVFGFGNVGALLYTTLVKFGYKNIKVYDKDAWRLKKAKQIGAETINSIEGHKFDVVFHTTASPQCLQQCIEIMQVEGRIVELSWYGEQKISLNLGGVFHYKRIRIISSQVSMIPKRRQQRWDYNGRKNLAVALLKDPVYDALITDAIPFKMAPSFYNLLRSGKQPDGLIWLLDYTN